MKKNRGWLGFAVVLSVLLFMAVALDGTLGQKDRRVTYPQLLTMIENGQVKSVAIRNTSLVGLKTDTKIADREFPDNDYDFETTIGADFIETVRQMEASKS